MTARPETADLDRRIVAAAIRNGHTERSFRSLCRLTSRLAPSVDRLWDWVMMIDGRPEFVWPVLSSMERSTPTKDTQAPTLRAV